MPTLLTLNYQDALRRTRHAVGDAVGKHWDALGHYDKADVPRFVAAVKPIVKAGQARAIALSDAYLAKLTKTPTPGIDPSLVSGAAVRNGVSPDDEYEAPFVNVWTSLKNDGDWQAAVQSGRDRAVSSSLMDVALSTMASYVLFGQMNNSQADESGQIVAWRRVAEAGCCEFCQEIDGAHTGPDTPQPLHNRCGCTAEPIYGRSRPEGKYLDAGTTIGVTTIQDHGELGLVITQKGDSFTGPEAVVSAAKSAVDPKNFSSYEAFAAARAAERSAQS